MPSNRILSMILKIAGDTSGASGALRTFNKELEDSLRKSQAALSGISNLGKQLGTAGLALTIGISAPLLAAGKSSLTAAAQIETVSTSFKTLTGSAATAEKLLSQVRDFADKTPFEFPELARSTQKLLAFGFTADRVLPSLKSIGGVVASLGGGTPEIDRVTRALGQMSAKGKVSAEELNQLSDIGINGLKILSDAAGRSTAEMAKLVERGVVPAQAAIKALLAGFEKQGAGGLEAQSKTLTGIFSTLKDQVTSTAAELGVVLAPIAKRFAKEFVEPALETLRGLAKGFKDLPPAVQDAAVGFLVFVAAAGPTLLIAGKLAESAVTLTTALKTLSVAGLLPAGASAARFGALAAGAFVWTQTMGPALSDLAASVSELSTAMSSMVTVGSQASATGKEVASSLQSISDTIGLNQLKYANPFPGLKEAALETIPYLLVIRKSIDFIRAAGNYLNPKLPKPSAAPNPAVDLFKIPDPTSGTGLEKQAAADARRKSTEFAEELKASLAGVTAAASKTTEVKLPEWANFTSESFRALAANLGLLSSDGKVSDALLNIFREEAFNGAKAGFKTAQDAIFDFVTAGESYGKKLAVVPATNDGIAQSFALLQERVNLAGSNLTDATKEGLTAEIERVRKAAQDAAGQVQQFTSTLNAQGKLEFAPTQQFLELQQILTNLDILSAQVGRSMGAVPEQLAVNWSKVKTPLLEVDRIMANMGMKSTRETRMELNATTEALQKLYDLRRTAPNGGDINNDIKRLEERRKDLQVEVGDASEKSNRKVKESLIEVSTVTTNVAQGLSRLVFEGGKFGEVMERVGRQIGEGVFSKLIEQMLTSSGLLQGLGNKLGGLLKNIPGLNGIPVIKNAVGSGASAASGAATAGLPGSAAAAASSSLMGTIGAVAQVGTLVSSIIGNFQQAASNRKLGQIEETGRGSLNQLISLQETFNAYLPSLPQIHDRLKELRIYGIGTFAQPGFGAIPVNVVATQAASIGPADFAPLQWLDDIHDRLTEIVKYGVQIQGATVPAAANSFAQQFASTGAGGAAASINLRAEGLTVVGFSTVDELIDVIVRKLQQRGVKVNS